LIAGSVQDPAKMCSIGEITMRLRSVRLSLPALLLLSLSAFAGPPSEIKFGIFATEAWETLRPNWEPFLAAQSAATGLRVSAYYAPTYEALVDALSRNEVQIAWLGNKSAIEAAGRANSEVFAQIAKKDGETAYYSQLIVHADSPLQTMEDVLKCDRSLNFGMGDPGSTSGYLAPATYLFAAESIDPKTCFKSVQIAGHEANAIAVAGRKADIATFNSDEFERLTAAKPDLVKQIRVIWTSPPLPLDPLVWRKDLDPSVKIKLCKFFLSYGRLGTPDENAAARAVLSKLLWAPFHPSSNDQLLTVRILEATRKLVAAGESARAAAIAEVATLAEQRSKLANDPLQKLTASFVAAERSGNRAEMVSIMETLAAGYAATR
jgi:phosphonate transport system substrate-binding protein